MLGLGLELSKTGVRVWREQHSASATLGTIVSKLEQPAVALSRAARSVAQTARMEEACVQAKVQREDERRVTPGVLSGKMPGVHLARAWWRCKRWGTKG